MNKKSRYSYIFTFALTSLCLFAVLWMSFSFLKKKKARFVAESGQLITMGRLQTVGEQKGNVVFLGSSRTERLTPGEGNVVVGVPGSSFWAGLNFLNERNMTKGNNFVLEGNSILGGILPRIIEDSSTLSFKLGKRIPLLSFRAKPSSLLLTAINYIFYKDQWATYVELAPFPYETMDFTGEKYENYAFTNQEKKFITTGIEKIKDLKKRGCFVCFAIYPQKNDLEKKEPAIFPAIWEIVQKTGIPVLDYYHHFDINKLKYSDTHHFISNCRETYKFRNTVARDVILYSSKNGK